MSQTTIAIKQTNPSGGASQRRFRVLSATVEGLLYLAPTLIGLGIFVFWPIVKSLQLSLNRIAPFGNQMRYVGLENYINLFKSSDYWESVKITLIFVIGTVPIGIALAVVLAIALAYPLRNLSWLHRTLIFVPIVISSGNGRAFPVDLSSYCRLSQLWHGAAWSFRCHAGRAQLALFKGLGVDIGHYCCDMASVGL